MDMSCIMELFHQFTLQVHNERVVNALNYGLKDLGPVVQN